MNKLKKLLFYIFNERDTESKKYYFIMFILMIIFHELCDFIIR